MDLELLFSLAGMLAMTGWLTLLASPWIPGWSDKVAGQAIPILLSIGYIALSVWFSSDTEGGFGSLAEVAQLFSQQGALLAGWVHFLAFDLLVGTWICKTARSESISFYLVLPCLPITFLFGPAGFLAFSLVRRFGKTDPTP